LKVSMKRWLASSSWRQEPHGSKMRARVNNIA
jgi:hypothetical protein